MGMIETNPHLRDMTQEERIDFLTEIVAQNALEAIRAIRRLEDIADRFEGLLRSMARVIVEEDRQKWQGVIERVMERRSAHG